MVTWFQVEHEAHCRVQDFLALFSTYEFCIMGYDAGRVLYKWLWLRPIVLLQLLHSTEHTC